MFDEQLVTVWSAPNYCYRCGNSASIMTVHEDGSRGFIVYEAAPENASDKGQGKRLVNVKFFGGISPTYLNLFADQHAILCLISICITLLFYSIAVDSHRFHANQVNTRCFTSFHQEDCAQNLYILVYVHKYKWTKIPHTFFTHCDEGVQCASTFIWFYLILFCLLNLPF